MSPINKPKKCQTSPKLCLPFFACVCLFFAQLDGPLWITRNIFARLPCPTLFVSIRSRPLSARSHVCLVCLVSANLAWISQIPRHKPHPKALQNQPSCGHAPPPDREHWSQSSRTLVLPIGNHIIPGWPQLEISNIGWHL